MDMNSWRSAEVITYVLEDNGEAAALLEGSEGAPVRAKLIGLTVDDETPRRFTVTSAEALN
jgi:hypothetical protein